MKLDFPDPPTCGKIAVSLKNITHYFDDLQLFDGFSTIIENKRKIAVTGRNGFGKSTLLDIITGNLKPSQGTVEHYHSLDISYFKQNQINDLPKDVTVMEYMESITPFSYFHKVNSILASFMFFKDSWDKKISILSGGEKVRLCFIKLILNAGNLIILDEPTTHLDINSRDILINALKKLNSTLIFVSHDTYFTDSLADTVYYFSSTRSIEKFEGNLSEFFDHRPEEIKSNVLKTSTENYLEISKNAVDYELMKKNRNKIKLLERKISDLEKKIELKEKEKDSITVKLSSDTADYAELGAKLKNIEIFLEKLVNDWENALEEIEVLKNVEKNS
jgi:ATP-binding cassette subfamily F protein 3